MKKSSVIIAAVILAALALILWLTLDPGLRATALRYYGLVTDREWIRATVQSFGWAAPLMFIGIQIAQVILSPIPGEATGVIGGYIFGALQGFVFSSIGLACGSVINFGIGRLLGDRYVRRLIPEEKFRRLDRMINRQGVIVAFFMFVIPGFPKDYLCLLLGLSTMSLKLFLVLASVGRMPGTLFLSLQGAALYEKDYVLLGIVAGVTLVLALLAVLFRDHLYRWLEKFNS